MRAPIREHDIQKAIVKTLQCAGLTVYETTAYRQKGPSGVDKGIPDLLVVCPLCSMTFIGLEVKVPGRWKYSSIEQEAAHKEGHFSVVTSPLEAVRALIFALREIESAGDPGLRTILRLRSLEDALAPRSTALQTDPTAAASPAFPSGSGVST